MSGAQYRMLLLIIISLMATLAPAAANRSDQRGGIVTTVSSTAWKMTDSERIARRLALQTSPRSGMPASADRGYRESIDGRTHPELFLPYELFDFLIEGVDASSKKGASTRRWLDPELPGLGYDVDRFWSQLTLATQSYVRLRKLRRQHGPHSTIFTTATGQKSLVPVAQDVCEQRIAALNEARRLLGGEHFDRFLYAAVAPECGSSEGGTSPDRSGQLRYMARGCK